MPHEAGVGSSVHLTHPNLNLNLSLAADQG